MTRFPVTDNLVTVTLLPGPEGVTVRARMSAPNKGSIEPRQMGNNVLCTCQVAPEPDWGPGDKAYTDDYLAMRYRKAFRCKQHPYGYQGYDNYGMHYPYYPGYATGVPPQQPAYHM